MVVVLNTTLSISAFLKMILLMMDCNFPLNPLLRSALPSNRSSSPIPATVNYCKCIIPAFFLITHQFVEGDRRWLLSYDPATSLYFLLFARCKDVERLHLSIWHHLASQKLRRRWLLWLGSDICAKGYCSTAQHLKKIMFPSVFTLVVCSVTIRWETPRDSSLWQKYSHNFL